MAAQRSIWPLLFAIIFAGAGNTAEQGEEKGKDLARYAMLVQELDARRRLNVLYPNPQSSRDGLQVGYVHVGTGNLTFKRRDIVARANGAVAFARVYDSRMPDNDDFGPGWRLSLAEELIVAAGGATYIDRAGARHRFLQTEDGYAPDAPTAAHAGTRIVVKDGRAVLRQQDGTTRVFETIPDSGSIYRVTQVKTRARRLDFSYAAGALAAISHEGKVLFRIGRNDKGRVASVADRHGRSCATATRRGGP